MRLADPFNKGRPNENKLPDATDEKETDSKPAKLRSDGKWTFDWNLSTTLGAGNIVLLPALLMFETGPTI
uniref:Uncharacterized protein n=1 Tax=Daphnia galeata TaxID=27404 RepID=A0A8J2W2P6_9CRUS|nr:unnamed protein product [Daphnia galeata]